MIYYHYTHKNNISNILSTGKLKDNGLGVYVCNSIDNLLEFINLYIGTKQIQKENTVIIKFESNDNFEESFDHNSYLLDGAKAFVCYDDVTINNVEVCSLND